MVYDFLGRFEKLTDFDIDRTLLNSAQKAHSRYVSHLEAKKLEEEKKAKVGSAANLKKKTDAMVAKQLKEE
jgi:hypothetical protein